MQEYEAVRSVARVLQTYDEPFVGVDVLFARHNVVTKVEAYSDHFGQFATVDVQRIHVALRTAAGGWERVVAAFDVSHCIARCNWRNKGYVRR